MSERINACPVCDSKLEINDITHGDWTIYNCPKHGQFTVSRDLSVTLVRNPEKMRNLADYLERHPLERKDVICTSDVGLQG